MNSNRMAIPKRFSSLMSEMIAMQPRFEIISSKQAKLLSRLRIFRAAYDFLLLRSLVGDCSEEVIKFWSKVQLKTVKNIHHRKVNRKQLNGR
jgi:poly(A) polymerase